MVQLQLSTYFEIGACLASLFAWNNLRHSGYMRLFPILLFGVVIGEVAGAYIKYKAKADNAYLYNLFVTPFINLMYYGILYYAVGQVSVKKIILLFSALYLPFAIITTLYFYNDDLHYNILSHCIGSLFLIFVLVRLFYEMMINPAELDFLRKPAFYIFFALLLFHVASLAYFTMANWLGTHHRFIGIVYQMFDILNYVLYGTYIISFLWIRLKDTY